ncbi:protein cereblon-like [Choristoneura fumiferana]|uniref:protein cereblon-like n=1 Tax=Choristoneura fumiferana TaxID=7141 RepID=UPI003D15A968
MNLKCALFLKFAIIIVIPANSELSTIIYDNEFTNQASQNNDTEIHYEENVLCRGCGSEVASTNFIISKLSPASLYSFNDTLFSKESVLVQVVSNDYIFQFPVIVFEQSTCVGIGEWEADNSWFPGYQWKLCVCPDCAAFLGWIFEPINPRIRNSPDKIFSLILTSLIGESFTDSLAQHPVKL